MELADHTGEDFQAHVADQNSSWGITYWLPLVLIAEKEATLKKFVESKHAKSVLYGLVQEYDVWFLLLHKYSFQNSRSLLEKFSQM